MFRIALSTLALSTGTAIAAPGAYATLSFGSVAVEEAGYAGVTGLAFAGPTVDHDICSSTATITLGAEPQVGTLDARENQYRAGLGWRGEGAVAWEFAYFNVARLASQARSGAYAVAQPACPDWTVSAVGVKVERVSASGLSLGPVYHLALARRLELELRATLNIYDQQAEAQWLVEVTESNTGDPVRTYPTAGVTGTRDSHGVDLGFGLGLAYALDERRRLRFVAERQVIGDLTVQSLSFGIAVGF